MVDGVPTLVVLYPVSGRVLNNDAVGNVYEDEGGEKFPWASDNQREQCVYSAE